MARLFNETLNPCPFGFWSNDPLFQQDADKMVTFVFRTLGEDYLSVELSSKIIWSQFERACRNFNAEVIEYEQISNLANVLGFTTGSFDINAHPSQQTNVNLTNLHLRQTLNFLDRQAEPYINAIGLGVTAQTMTGSVTLQLGKQDYDLYTDLKDSSGVPLASLMPSGSQSKIHVYEVYHFAPIQYVFNSNLASNFMAAGMPVESYIPDTRFYVLPLFEDVLRASQLKAAQKVRRSHFSYRITGRNLRLFPAPSNLISGWNDRVWLQVGFDQHPLPQFASTLEVSGTRSTTSNPANTFVDNTVFGASNPANAPFGLMIYKNLNPWARNWIAEYTLALCREYVGDVRSKVESFPVAAGQVKLNGDSMIQRGREDKEKLTTALKERLESLSFDKLQERETARAKSMIEQLALVPIPPQSLFKMA